MSVCKEQQTVTSSSY